MNLPSYIAPAYKGVGSYFASSEGHGYGYGLGDFGKDGNGPSHYRGNGNLAVGNGYGLYPREVLLTEMK